MRLTTALDDNVFDFDYLLHPGTKFEHPRDVVSHSGLTLAEKRAILASWASAARNVSSILRFPATRQQKPCPAIAAQRPRCTPLEVAG